MRRLLFTYDDKMRRTRIKQHIADPRPLHHIQLHPAASLSDAICDFLHGLDDFWMVGLAGIAKTLGKIVWANAVEVDARHRQNGVEVVEHSDIFQQSAHQHLFVCLAVVRRLVGDPGIVVGAPIGPE